MSEFATIGHKAKLRTASTVLREPQCSDSLWEKVDRQRNSVAFSLLVTEIVSVAIEAARNGRQTSLNRLEDPSNP